LLLKDLKNLNRKFCTKNLQGKINLKNVEGNFFSQKLALTLDILLNPKKKSEIDQLFLNVLILNIIEQLTLKFTRVMGSKNEALLVIHTYQFLFIISGGKNKKTRIKIQLICHFP